MQATVSSFQHPLLQQRSGPGAPLPIQRTEPGENTAQQGWEPRMAGGQQGSLSLETERDPSGLSRLESTLPYPRCL